MQNHSVDRSSYQNKNEEDENEPDTEKEESLIKGDSEYDLAMKLPVKLHIYKIEVISIFLKGTISLYKFGQVYMLHNNIKCEIFSQIPKKIK